MAIAFVQVAANQTGSSVTSIAATFGSAQSSGNTNIVSVLTQTATQPTVADTASNTYSLAASGGNAGQSLNLWLFTATSIAGGSSVQVTASDTSSGYMGIVITEYSGVGSTQDGTAQSGSGFGTAATSSSSLTTTNANDLIISIAAGSAGTWTAGTGYTFRGPGNVFEGFEDQIVTSTGSFNGAMTLSSNNQWGLVVAAFKASGGGGSVTPTLSGNLLVTGVANVGQLAAPNSGTLRMSGGANVTLLSPYAPIAGSLLMTGSVNVSTIAPIQPISGSLTMSGRVYLPQFSPSVPPSAGLSTAEILRLLGLI